MASGWRHRLASVAGVAAATYLAMVIANSPLVQSLFTVLPLVGHLPTDTTIGPEFAFEVTTVLVVLLAAFVPLYKPRPRRIVDTVGLVERRLLIALLALATIGYFDYTYRLPRSTLLLAAVVLAVALPAWFVAIRRRPAVGAHRALIVGDDPEAMEDILQGADLPVVGYVCPPSRVPTGVGTVRLADGGEATMKGLSELKCLGGLSQLDDVLIGYDIDTVVLAFARPDRGDFFGTLDACYDHGVTAKVHRNHADVVLTTDVGSTSLVDVDLDPWDWQDYVIKRLFDVVFAGTGLLVLAPVIFALAVAVKLDSNGPVLYAQERTATFGETFTVYKFRSMIPDAEAKTGVKLSEEDIGGRDPRVTRVGRVLRKTHLDEVPQLWSILVGDMSVVGPRPERPELDSDIETDVSTWRRRWFIKPGLTGLAQINGATGYDPEEKLRYDVAYIRDQSFWFDSKIIVRQMWLVGEDVAGVLVRSLRTTPSQ